MIVGECEEKNPDAEKCTQRGETDIAKNRENAREENKGDDAKKR